MDLKFPAILILMTTTMALAEDLVQTKYTDEAAQLNLDVKDFSTIDLDQVHFNCFQDESNHEMVGVDIKMKVNAKLEAVLALIRNFDKYHLIFPDLYPLKTTNSESDHFVTEWEQRIPIPLVPNLHFKLDYWFSKSANQSRIRYQQNGKSNALVSDDGVILLVENVNETLYHERDYIHGKWGLLGFLSHDKALKEAISGVVVSTYAIKEAVKLKTIEDNTIAKTISKKVSSQDVDKCLKEKLTRKF